jgi:hypothetical protein
MSDSFMPWYLKRNFVSWCCMVGSAVSAVVGIWYEWEIFKHVFLGRDK